MKKRYHLFIFLFLALFSIQNVFAQLEAHLTNGEGWIKGNYVEIAINPKGVYGGFNTNKPTSFHDNREYNPNDLFGFIANPQADGWVDYDGDFFSSGNPEESFGIQINGENYNNFNTFETTQEIPGSIIDVNIISSGCFKNTAQIIWEGNIEGLNVKRYFSVTEDGLFVQMTTYIKNRSTETKQNVFFMHNVDPDNNATLSGVFNTDMNLVSQASSTTDNISLVTASQQPLNIPEDMDGSYVSYYSKNENARVSYGGFENRDAQDIWYGNFVTNTEGSFTPFIDKAISIAFNLSDIEPNATRKFTYYYVLKEIDETFEPIIVNIFTESPSTCNGNNGKIIFSGLDTGVLYSISYFKDGILVPNQNYIANSNGEIEIENLSSGIYSNILINYNGCNTSIDTEIELLDPTPSNFDLTKVDLTNCFDIDGKIIIRNLTSNTIYNFSYLYNDIIIELQNLIANQNGEIIITNLNEGIYSNFSLEQYECITTNNNTIELIRPEISSATFSTSSSVFSENSTIQITPSIPGNYLYSIDNEPYQSSPIFNNVSSGIHQFSVIDIYGCEIANFEKTLVKFMKVFTPNNDGIKDYWQIVGGQELIQPEIYIYNRYGKFLKQLSVNSIGWDGTFNGALLPTNDYWFKIIYKDENNKTQEFISHFTLKR